MNIQEKLLYIQQNLKAPKNQYNKFGDYKYRSCEDIQEAVKPILQEIKAVLIIRDDVVQIGGRFYIKATAILQDVESPEKIDNVAFARETEEKPKMDAAQITGSCSSYARKYALNGLFCIDDAKDPDDPAVNGQPQNHPRQQDKPRQQASQKPDKTEMVDQLRREAARTGTDLARVCERYGVRRISDLTEEQYKRAMNAFKKMETVPPPVPEGEWQYKLDFGDGNLPFR